MQATKKKENDEVSSLARFMGPFYEGHLLSQAFLFPGVLNKVWRFLLWGKFGNQRSAEYGLAGHYAFLANHW